MPDEINGEENARLGGKCKAGRKKLQGKKRKKDGPWPVRVSDSLCPAVHILGT